MFNLCCSRYLAVFSVLPALFFFASPVLAIGCFSPVPGLMPGEPYEHQPIIASRLSNTEYHTLREMFAGLEGNWQGEAELDSGGSLRIRANLESIEKRTRRGESYRLSSPVTG